MHVCVCVCVCVQSEKGLDTRVLRVYDGNDGVSWRAMGSVYSCQRSVIEVAIGRECGGVKCVDGVWHRACIENEGVCVCVCS